MMLHLNRQGRSKLREIWKPLFVKGQHIKRDPWHCWCLGPLTLLQNSWRWVSRLKSNQLSETLQKAPAKDLVISSYIGFSCFVDTKRSGSSAFYKHRPGARHHNLSVALSDEPFASSHWCPVRGEVPNNSVKTNLWEKRKKLNPLSLCQNTFKVCDAASYRIIGIVEHSFKLPIRFTNVSGSWKVSFM